MSKAEVPESFLQLHRYLTGIVRRESAAQTNKLRTLPLTAPQLARVAENRPEFLRAVPDLFGIGTPEEYSSRKVWENHLTFAKRVVPELLRRTGYYLGVISGKGPKSYYQEIVNRVAPANRSLTILYLLDNCRFPKSCFNIAGHSIERLSPSQLQRLGPPPEVCAYFFQNEAIDSKGLADYWFLRVTKSVYTAYNYDLDGDERIDNHGDRSKESVTGDFEVAAGHFATGAQTNVSLPGYLQTLLGLALHNPEFFEIPVILVCEEKWRRIRVRYHAPQRGERYQVEEHQWPMFERWLQLYELGLEAAKGSRAVTTASHRYLQATFASGDIFPDWTPELELVEYPWIGGFRRDRGDVFEDALLHYVFSLEALLAGDGNNALSEKLAVTCALLVGRDDREADFVRDFVKRAYDSRSLLVHGKSLKRTLDLAKLRRLCQRSLALVICYFATDDMPELDRFKKDLAVSSALKRKVKELQAAVFPLLPDECSLAD